MSKILVNAVGDACPIPVTKTIHALSGMTEAGTVEVHVDNETAVQNLNRLATGKGLKFSAEKREEKLFVVTLTVDDPAAVSGTAPEETACAPDNRDNTVVLIGTNCLGSGDDTLGATLMKGFLYALSQQERLPRTILFYNGGAKGTNEGFHRGPEEHGGTGCGDPHLRHLPELLRSHRQAGRGLRHQYV